MTIWVKITHGGKLWMNIVERVAASSPVNISLTSFEPPGKTVVRIREDILQIVTVQVKNLNCVGLVDIIADNVLLPVSTAAILILPPPQKTVHVRARHDICIAIWINICAWNVGEVLLWNSLNCPVRWTIAGIDKHFHSFISRYHHHIRITILVEITKTNCHGILKTVQNDTWFPGWTCTCEIAEPYNLIRKETYGCYVCIAIPIDVSAARGPCPCKICDMTGIPICPCAFMGVYQAINTAGLVKCGIVKNSIDHIRVIISVNVCGAKFDKIASRNCIGVLLGKWFSRVCCGIDQENERSVVARNNVTCQVIIGIPCKNCIKLS